MEKIINGNLIISKGKNIVIVETAYDLPEPELRKRDIERELYMFLDGLVGKGYEILNSSRTIFFTGADIGGQGGENSYDDRWVLTTPK